MSGSNMLGFIVALAHASIFFRLYESCCKIGREIPTIPDVRVNCTTEHAITVKPGTSLIDCIELCERMAVCTRLEYYSPGHICILKDSAAITPATKGQCISIDVSQGETSLTDACTSRPCGDASVCLTDLDAADGFMCELSYCPKPVNVNYATLLSDGYTKVGQGNVYKCDEDYTGSYGSPHIKCTGNGGWTTTEFRCLPNCPGEPLPVANAEIRNPSARTYPINYILQYACKSGFYNISQTELVCNATGEWSADTYSPCLPYCSHTTMPAPIFGGAFPGDNYTIFKPGKIYCNHDSYFDPEKPFVTCKRDGTWAPREGICFKYCGVPISPANGAFTDGLTEPQYKTGVRVYYTCNQGYEHYPPVDGAMICSQGYWSATTICRLISNTNYFGN